ncbi:MAG: hypothetical protein M4579_006521 [Chaenotheca gracillima]|nr:MAG: hypothetical protein M4579_006521 [Chaenotheca gracillima]
MSAAATTVSRPSPRSSWDPASPSNARHQKAATSPLSRSGCRSPTSPAATADALRAPLTARPRLQQDHRATSPSYFGLVVEPSSDPNESEDAKHARRNWSPPSSAVRSKAAMSPRAVPPDPTSEFEAFRRQSEGRTFDLGHGSLSSFSDVQSPGGSKSASGPLGPPKTSPPAIVDDPMEIDPPPTAEPPPPTVSEFPRFQSPATIDPSQTTPVERSQLSHIDDRHPRLSLPTNRVNPPSPSTHAGRPSQRASTLPSPSDHGDGPALVSPQKLVERLDSSPDEILLLDLRVYPRFSQSRIRGALNLCIPTTLLKRASFNLQKLADTFTKEEERKRFERWRSCKIIMVYDESSTLRKDAVSCVNTLRKFTNDGWKGMPCILRGGFSQFSKAFPHMVDNQPTSGPAVPSKQNLSIDPPMAGAAPVAGGCPMPATKTAANPFFGNIRQNMDLIGGVGQMPIKRPSVLTRRGESELPKWLRESVDEKDQGKAVSDRFLSIEKAEQRRMQEALSSNVCYEQSSASAVPSFQIAGIEKGGKNRYNNIWPYDHARVRLQGAAAGGLCDYVNASHIKASRSNKEYIATQAPLPGTFDDFWRVVWEQDVRVIVMLTAEKEDGQHRADPYWIGKDFGPLRLNSLSERRVALEPSKVNRPGLGQRRSTNPGQGSPVSQSQSPHMILRKFTLAHRAHPFTPIREITQLAYSSWPDFGAPAHPSQVLGLVEQCDAVVRSTMSPTLPSHNNSESPDPPRQSPVLVHCSAGCGRTGTFCTIDSVVDMLKRQRADRLPGSRNGPISPARLDHPRTPGAKPQSSPQVPPGRDQKTDSGAEDLDLIAATVEDFRHQRLSMVQNLRQFVLCYETVLEWLVTQQSAEMGKANSATSVPPATGTLGDLDDGREAKENARRSFHT